MWAELPENPHSQAEQNERVYESDMLTITTDVRMAKVPELFASGAGHGTIEQSQGSGGGGPVECVFWAKEVMTQWRIRGSGYVIGPDIEGPESESSGVRTVKSVLGERMRVVKEEGKEGWSWKKEVNAHFENLSPGMRGSFKNPSPGRSVSIPVKGEGEALGQKVTGGLEDELAQKNFRVVVIRPEEVEQVDLTEPDKARRWNYKFVGAEGDNVGEWTVEEQWP
jgi:pyridoxamine 5'-phosphate oxidase